MSLRLVIVIRGNYETNGALNSSESRSFDVTRDGGGLQSCKKNNTVLSSLTL